MMSDATYAKEQEERVKRRAFAMEVMTVAQASKEGLNAAFRRLRKQGFIARQGFSCCRSCAGCELANEVSGKIDAGKLRDDFKGVVFHSIQSKIFDKNVHGPGVKINKVYLSFGQVGTTKHGDQGVPTKKAGKLVCAALDAEGVAYKWNGKADTAILIDPCPGLWPKKDRSGWTPTLYGRYC